MIYIIYKKTMMIKRKTTGTDVKRRTTRKNVKEKTVKM